MTPIEQINVIQQESDQLQAKLKGFTSPKGSKEYRYLEEMLTRLLLKLDGIESEGKDEIRQARKQAIKSVQAGLDHLELIGMANEVGSDDAATSAKDNPTNQNTQDNGAASTQEPAAAMETDQDGDAEARANEKSSQGGDQATGRDQSRVKDLTMDSEVKC